MSTYTLEYIWPSCHYPIILTFQELNHMVDLCLLLLWNIADQLITIWLPDHTNSFIVALYNNCLYFYVVNQSIAILIISTNIVITKGRSNSTLQCIWSKTSMYILQLRCTYCNFDVHTATSMYILQLRCTYCNFDAHTATSMYILQLGCTYCNFDAHTATSMYILQLSK